MGRILAIDYGRKRTGIAVTDTLQLIANGLTTVPTAMLQTFLDDYLGREPVERIVVGLPRQMDGRPSETMPYIDAFVRAFRQRHPDLPVDLFDERFTSVLAHQAVISGGVKKKDRQNKALYDEVSATIILQGYMESKKTI
ncbi:MAG: Holliday junction resolvase RuvX [Bacteroidales bacterium]|nr:Holliday junction resolvase RuvX [Bacteroidales bacterium]